MQIFVFEPFPRELSSLVCVHDPISPPSVMLQLMRTDIEALVRTVLVVVRRCRRGHVYPAVSEAPAGGDQWDGVEAGEVELLSSRGI